MCYLHIIHLGTMQIFNTSAVVIQSTLHQSLTMFIQISHRPITNLIIWFIQLFCLIEIKMTKNTTSKQRNGIMCVTWRYYLKLIRHQLSQKKTGLLFSFLLNLGRCLYLPTVFIYCTMHVLTLSDVFGKRSEYYFTQVSLLRPL